MCCGTYIELVFPEKQYKICAIKFINIAILNLIFKKNVKDTINFIEIAFRIDNLMWVLKSDCVK